MRCSVAEEHVGDEPFAVLLGDDLIHPSVPLLAEMLRVHERYGRSVIAVQEVPPRGHRLLRLRRAGVRRRATSPACSRSSRSRRPKRRPSNLAAIGRYVLTPDIFDALARNRAGRGGEIQLTDAINLLAKEQAVYAYKFDHGRYDVGQQARLPKATVEFALERDDVGEDFRVYLAELRRERRAVGLTAPGLSELARP